MTRETVRTLVAGFLAGAFTLAAFYSGPGVSLLVVYMVWMGISIQWSSLVENSFYYFWMLSSLPLFVLVVRQLEPPDWSRILWYLVIPVSVSAVWGISEWVITMRRSNGPLIDPNAWASLQNIFFFVILSQYLTGKTSSRPATRLQEGLLFLLMVGFFSAYSRGATVVWLVAFSFVVVAAWIGRLNRKRIVTVILISTLSFSIVHGYVSQTDASHDEGYTLNVEDQAWSQRFAIWSASWKIYLEHPISGSGLATFKVLYPKFRTTGDLTNTGNFVHNDYLQFLQEGGPVQLLFVLGLVLYLTSRLFVSSREILTTTASSSAEEVPRRTIEMLILAVAAGTAFAHALINFTLLLLPNQMMIGFILARILYLSGDTEPVATERRIGKPFVALILATLWGSWSLLALDALGAALIYKHRGIPFADWVRDDPVRYFDTINWLANHRGANSSNHFALATLYRKAMDEQTDAAAIRSLGIATAAEYRIGLRQNPYRYAIQIYYADLLEHNPEIYSEFPNEGPPVQILERALAVNPIYIRLYLEVARHYEDSGDPEAAYHLLRDRAWPWLGLHYSDFEFYQQHYLQRLRRLAVELGDGAMIDVLNARAESQATAIAVPEEALPNTP
jgi:O-antigen ligase